MFVKIAQRKIYALKSLQDWSQDTVNSIETITDGAKVTMKT